MASETAIKDSPSSDALSPASATSGSYTAEAHAEVQTSVDETSKQKTT